MAAFFQRTGERPAMLYVMTVKVVLSLGRERVALLEAVWSTMVFVIISVLQERVLGCLVGSVMR